MCSGCARRRACRGLRRTGIPERGWSSSTSRRVQLGLFSFPILNDNVGVEKSIILLSNYLKNNTYIWLSASFIKNSRCDDELGTIGRCPVSYLPLSFLHFCALLSLHPLHAATLLARVRRMESVHWATTKFEMESYRSKVTDLSTGMWTVDHDRRTGRMRKSRAICHYVTEIGDSYFHCGGRG